jgi:hypothetical protein
VPHVRTSVRGLIKTGEAPQSSDNLSPKQNLVPHISLVFGEMWDSTALSPKIFPAKCAYFHGEVTILPSASLYFTCLFKFSALP